jgi:hypothetical protein
MKTIITNKLNIKMMKKNFTRLASVGIACLCIILPVMGQEKLAVISMAEENDLRKNETELRAANEYWWPYNVKDFD